MQRARLLRRFALLVVTTPAVLFLVAVGLHWCYWDIQAKIAAEDVESIEIHLLRRNPPPGSRPGFAQDEARVTTSDPVHIRALLKVLAKAELASEHKCGHDGTISIHRRNGVIERLD